jgi:membrane associated rhomboid family serine protease
MISNEYFFWRAVDVYRQENHYRVRQRVCGVAHCGSPPTTSLTPRLVLDKFASGSFDLHVSLRHLSFIVQHAGFVHVRMRNGALLGSQRFLRYYLITGVGAGLCVFLTPTAYCSPSRSFGAIYGVLLAYGMTFPDRIIYMYIFPLPASISS